MIARRVIAHGLVQGVFYRVQTQQKAQQHNVVGWVRNLPDETVEAHLEGEQPAVDELVAWMRSGPGQARVRDLDVDEATLTGAASFDIT